MLDLLKLTLVFVLAGMSIWCVLCVAVFKDSKDDLTLAFAGLSLAPALVAWLCASCLRVLPGQSPAVYVGMVAGLSAVPLLLLVRDEPRTRLIALPRLLSTAAQNAGWMGWLTAILLFEAMIVIGVLAWVNPLKENDALEYSTVARLIFEHRSLAFYPAVDSTLTGGFYGPWTHPAGYPALLAFCNFLQQHADTPGLVRVPAAYSFLALVLLIWCVGGRTVGGFGAAFAVGTPLFVMSATNTYIDPFRVSAAFAAMAVTCLVLSRKEAVRPAAAAVLGIAAGLAFFCHSTGILVLVFCALLLIVLGRQQFWHAIVLTLVMLSVALVVVAPDVTSNIRKLGAIVADSSPVWSLAHIRADEHLRLARNLDTTYQIIKNGLLRGLFDPGSFGLTFWFGGVGAVIFLRWSDLGFVITRDRLQLAFDRLNDDARRQLIWLIVVTAWAVMAVAATSIGVLEFVKNPRYVLTVVPPLCLLAGFAVANLGEQRKRMTEYTQ